ncbi:MAG: hypothetical protein ACXWNK_14695 [Vulcanimicrobiaceae bacterium]
MDVLKAILAHVLCRRERFWKEEKVLQFGDKRVARPRDPPEGDSGMERVAHRLCQCGEERPRMKWRYANVYRTEIAECAAAQLRAGGDHVHLFAQASQ